MNCVLATVMPDVAPVRYLEVVLSFHGFGKPVTLSLIPKKRGRLSASTAAPTLSPRYGSKMSRHANECGTPGQRNISSDVECPTKRFKVDPIYKNDTEPQPTTASPVTPQPPYLVHERRDIAERQFDQHLQTEPRWDPPDNLVHRIRHSLRYGMQAPRTRGNGMRPMEGIPTITGSNHVDVSMQNLRGTSSAFDIWNGEGNSGQVSAPSAASEESSAFEMRSGERENEDAQCSANYTPEAKGEETCGQASCRQMTSDHLPQSRTKVPSLKEIVESMPPFNTRIPSWNQHTNTASRSLRMSPVEMYGVEKGRPLVGGAAALQYVPLSIGTPVSRSIGKSSLTGRNFDVHVHLGPAPSTGQTWEDPPVVFTETISPTTVGPPSHLSPRSFPPSGKPMMPAFHETNLCNSEVQSLLEYGFDEWNIKPPHTPPFTKAATPTQNIDQLDTVSLDMAHEYIAPDYGHISGVPTLRGNTLFGYPGHRNELPDIVQDAYAGLDPNSTFESVTDCLAGNGYQPSEMDAWYWLSLGSDQTYSTESQASIFGDIDSWPRPALQKSFDDVYLYQ